ncbi:unnamed protein product [Peniophora sp. CBMAI 1063]|nr:unnamed protein product [Peniophora sp. CBMAI 1063]
MLTLPRILNPAFGPSTARASSRHLTRFLTLSCAPIGVTLQSVNRITPRIDTLTRISAYLRTSPCCDRRLLHGRPTLRDLAQLKKKTKLTLVAQASPKESRLTELCTQAVRSPSPIIVVPINGLVLLCGVDIPAGSHSIYIRTSVPSLNLQRWTPTRFIATRHSVSQ